MVISAGRSVYLVGQATAAVALALLAIAESAQARTPTRTFGNTPTPTRTSNRPIPKAVIAASATTVHSGARVTLRATVTSGRVRSFDWTYYPDEDDPIIQIETSSRGDPTASFIAPPVTEAIEVTISLRLENYGSSGSGYSSVTITIVPAGAMLLDIGSVTGLPGQVVQVGMMLRTLGYAVREIEHDLEFSPWAAVVARADGSPDCAPPENQSAAARFAFAPDGCVPGSSCTHVRAALLADQGTFLGGEVYRCRLLLSADPADTCAHPLGCANAIARGFEGEERAVSCRAGEAVAEFSAVTPDIVFEVSPSPPRVGDEVALRFSATGSGGSPVYRLSGTQPHFEGNTAQISRADFGEVEFLLRAACPGTSDLRISVEYETAMGCVGRQYAARTGVGKTFSVEVLDAAGFEVHGQVAEFPPCQGAMRGVAVTLNPLGRSVQTDLSAGAFSFPDVPPGDYTLTVSPSCNPFGCWPETPVSVTAQDVAVSICPLPAQTPTPTRAPTLVPTPTPTVIPTFVCPGDCNGNQAVSIDELVRIVRAALGHADGAECAASDADGDGRVEIDEAVRAVRASLEGCTAPYY